MKQSFPDYFMPRFHTENLTGPALNTLLMAVWRRQPKQTVMVHSDQGSQFSSYDWRDFLTLI